MYCICIICLLLILWFIVSSSPTRPQYVQYAAPQYVQYVTPRQELMPEDYYGPEGPTLRSTILQQLSVPDHVQLE